MLPPLVHGLYEGGVAVPVPQVMAGEARLCQQEPHQLPAPITAGVVQGREADLVRQVDVEAGLFEQQLDCCGSVGLRA